MKPRLYLDEDVSRSLVELLAARSIDAVSAHDSGALGLSDEQQLTRAAAQRSLMTYNCRDFARIATSWAASGRLHTGIILSYRQYSKSHLSRLVDRVAAFAEHVTADELHNAVYVLDDFQTR